MKKLEIIKFISCVSFFNNSSIHGLQHIVSTKRDISECILWMVTVMIAIIGVVYTSLLTWDRFQKNPTVISLDRDYKYWNTSFPAMTVCPFIKKDDKAVSSLANQLMFQSEHKESLIQFINELSDANYLTFDKVNSFNTVNPDDYVEIVMNTTFNLTYSAIRSNLIPPADLDWMSRSLSELGVCYTFNSKIVNYFDPRGKHFVWCDVYDPVIGFLDYATCLAQCTSGKKKPKHRIIGITPNKRFSRIKMKLHHNSSLVGNPLYGDVYAQVINMSSGGQIYIHNDKEIPDISSKGGTLPIFHFKMMRLTALSIINSEEVASLSIPQRKCRFLHESSLIISPLVYSYNLCRMNCRMQLSYNLCGCVPYFYWNLGNTMMSSL